MSASPPPADPTVNPWTRRSRAVAYQNPWIIVYHDEVLRPDGRPGIYGVVHFRNRATGVVALDEQDRVLLVGQYRYPLGAYSWELPEGGAPLNEDPLTAAQRELLEETGYTAARWELLVRAHLSNSVSDEEAFCYLATDLRPGQACPDGTELLQVRWAPFAEALAMTLGGEITDSLSVLGLQRLALLRRESGRAHPGP
jgi:8-oxo-dGTP pyrophosphatase MutT (NUDIX family)